MNQIDPAKTILALDVGESRIGVAKASSIARIASPFTTLQYDPDFFDELNKIIREHRVEIIVVGWPRSLDGESTRQTAYVEDFVEHLKKYTGLEAHLQDEALTSVKAKDELDSRNKAYSRADIDALAACYILEDYLSADTLGSV